MRKTKKKPGICLKKSHLAKNNNTPVSELLINSNPCTDSFQIANELNKFFSTIGSEISNSVPPTDRPPESYILNRPPDSPELIFDRIGPCHVLEIIKSFNNKTSLDLDGLSLNFIKFMAPVICTPLSHIFNLSLAQGVFPERLKTSRIVPIFKSGN
jgi:hypothetical protein